MFIRHSVFAGVLLLLFAAEASAAALSRVVTSAGALAVLGALLVMKSWPAQLSASVLPTAGGALALAGGAWWWWRLRALTASKQTDVKVSERFAPVAFVELPPEVDRDGLHVLLRRQFVALQSAWDAGDMVALGALTTPDMLAELCLERPAFAEHGAAAAGATEVVTVQANLLGFEALGADFVVSVEFSGLIRESAHGVAVPFRELWMLTRSNCEADGWRLARHQALV